VVPKTCLLMGAKATAPAYIVVTVYHRL